MKINNKVISLFDKAGKPPRRPESTKDLIEIVTLTTAEFMDMDYSLMAVESSLDIYGELMETYHFPLWLDPDNSLLCNTYFELKQTLDSLQTLHDDLRSRCIMVWDRALKDPGAQKHFWGREAHVVNKDLVEVFEAIYMMMSEMEYDSTIETSVNSFKTVLLEHLEQPIEKIKSE